MTQSSDCSSTARSLPSLSKSKITSSRALFSGSSLPKRTRHKRPVDGTELVAVGIAHIGQVYRSQVAVAQSRRILDRGASVRDCGVMELSHLLGRVAFEGDGAAVGGVAVSSLIGSLTQKVLPLCR